MINIKSVHVDNQDSGDEVRTLRKKGEYLILVTRGQLVYTMACIDWGSESPGNAGHLVLTASVQQGQLMLRGDYCEGEAPNVMKGLITMMIVQLTSKIVTPN